ncbi:MAG: hypothetical protein IMY80_03020 [Chloroflexi bacterium]|nr:hypothetical protein [Chloroflexota bacterium]
MNEMTTRSNPRSFDKRAILASEISIPTTLTEKARSGKNLLLILFALVLSSCTSRPDPPMTIVAPDQAETTLLAPVAVDPIDGESVPPPLTEATPAIIIEPSFPAPTPTSIPPSVGVPLEELSILSPGPGSMVNSPIKVKGFGGPSLDNRVQVRLIAEDGRLLSTGYSFLYSFPGRPGLFYIQMPFESQLVAERAWLEVRSFDNYFGMLRHLMTVEVTILSTGSDRIYPAIHGAEKLTIFRPREENVIAGGSVLIQGAGWVDQDVPLQIEIINQAGDVLGSGQVELDAPVVGQLGTFSVEIAYQTSVQQWARIGVYELHDELPGLVHYASVGVWLEP